jgi:uncharacterized repeat protein (TIGR04138 family)
MKVTSRPAMPRLRYHQDSYRFVFESLQHTQEKLRRPQPRNPDDENAHISGQELCDGIRDLAVKRFGLLARTVFAHWGIHCTSDFGQIVFELIERGEMRKTDRDTLADFSDVYDFDEVFERGYVIDTAPLFRRA